MKTYKLFIAILFIALFTMTMRPIADPDFWWHLRTGQWIIETHAIPHSDPFSFTNQGKIWIAHEWLSEIFIYATYQIGGFGLLILTFSAILTITFLLVFLRNHEYPYIAGFTILLGAIATAPTWGVRPQMLSYMFSALFLYLLDRFSETRRTTFLIPLPFLMLLWVNLHAGYALGLGILIIYIIGNFFELLTVGVKNAKFTSSPIIKNIQILCGFFILSALVALVNPNGIRLLTYPFQTLSSQAMQQNILEWFSPDFHKAEWQPLAWLILALIGGGLLRRKSISSTKTLLVIVFGYMALHSMRNVPLLAIAAVPVLVEEISSVVSFRKQNRQAGRFLQWVNILLVACAVLVAGLYFVSVNRTQLNSEKEKFPVAATNWIVQHHPVGNIFNTYGWGGYLIWRLFPDYYIFIDGRADLYGDAFINEYIHIEAGEPGWEASLADEDVGIILLEPTALLVRELRQSPNWEIVHSDNLSILFVHK